MVARYEFEIDTTRAVAGWEAEVAANLARTAGGSGPAAGGGPAGAADQGSPVGAADQGSKVSGIVPPGDRADAG